MIDKNKEQIINDIDIHIKGLKKEIADLERVKRKLEINEYISFEKELHTYLQISERHMLSRRNLYNFATYEKDMPIYKVYSNDNCEMISKEFKADINIEKEGWYHIILPSIPTKKSKEKSKYFTETAFNLLIKRHKELYFKQQKELPKFLNATVIYLHHLDKNSSYKSIPDIDNVDIKGITDILGSITFISDSMHHLDTVSLSILDDNAFTEIYVLDQKDFLKWIQHSIRFFDVKNQY